MNNRKAPSLTPEQKKQFYTSWYGHAMRCSTECPTITTYRDIPNVDAWLVRHWRDDPMLSMFIDHKTTRASSTGWKLVGGESDVNYYYDVLAKSYTASDIVGWQALLGVILEMVEVRSIGAIVGLERDELGMVIERIYAPPDIDRLALTGDVEYPLSTSRRRNPDTEKYTHEQLIKAGFIPHENYFRIVSRPMLGEFDGYGKSSAYLASCVSRVSVALWKHYALELDDNRTNELIAVNGVSWDSLQKLWLELNEYSTNAADSSPIDIFRNLGVLFPDDISDKISFDSHKMSRISEGMEEPREFMDLIAMIYAGIVQIDVNEVWQTDSGSFGNSKQSEASSRGATKTGSLQTLLLVQDAINQRVLPSAGTVEFQFDEVDEKTELDRALLHQILLGNAEKLKALNFRPDDYQRYLQENNVVDAEMGIIPAVAQQAEQRAMRDRIMPIVSKRRMAGIDDEIVEMRWSSAGFPTMRMLGRNDDFVRRVFR